MEELAYMVEHAAIYSGSQDCNRRYFDWLFNVQGSRLLDMRRASLATIGRGSATAYEEHDLCNGQGCKACGWVGEIIRRVHDTSAQRLDRRSL